MKLVNSKHLFCSKNITKFKDEQNAEILQEKKILKKIIYQNLTKTNRFLKNFFRMATFCPVDIFSSKISAFSSSLNFSMIFEQKRCLLLTSFKTIAVPTFYSVIEAGKLFFHYLKATPMLYVKSGFLQSLRLLHIVNFL